MKIVQTLKIQIQMKKDEYIQTLTTHQMGYDTLLGVVVSSPKCAVKVVSTWEHCPETGIHTIDDTDEYLCEMCYKNWMRSRNNA